MFKVIQQFEYETNRVLLDQMFKLRKRVFKDHILDTAYAEAGIGPSAA